MCLIRVCKKDEMRENMKLDRQGGGEDLRRVEGRENLAKIYCMKKKFKLENLKKTTKIQQLRENPIQKMDNGIEQSFLQRICKWVINI